MATKINVQTTFSPARVIQPIFTGGGVALDASGRLLATCVEDDALLIDLESGDQLARVEGVSLLDIHSIWNY